MSSVAHSFQVITTAVTVYVTRHSIARASTPEGVGFSHNLFVDETLISDLQIKMG
jgi:hypothetical protein